MDFKNDVQAFLLVLYSNYDVLILHYLATMHDVTNDTEMRDKTDQMATLTPHECHQ